MKPLPFISQPALWADKAVGTPLRFGMIVSMTLLGTWTIASEEKNTSNAIVAVVMTGGMPLMYLYALKGVYLELLAKSTATKRMNEHIAGTLIGLGLFITALGIIHLLIV